MWRVPLPPSNEIERLQALAACNIMDTPPDPRFDRIAWLARHLYQSELAFISFIDATSQWIKASAGPLPDRSWPRDQSICQLIISTGQPVISRDLGSDPRFAGHPMGGRRIGFYAGVPLLIDDNLAIGSLCVFSEAPHGTDDIDIEPLRVLAGIVTDAVEMFRRTEELARHSRIDPLTGLDNRRAFDEGLARAISRSQRTGEPLALVMVDLDGFKEVNDCFGHPAGDALLRAVGAALTAVELRAGDVMARYGGEEFAIILPGADTRAARTVAERVRATLTAAGIRRPDLRRLTASIGVASQPASILDMDRLVAAADAALYRAKEEGRDRISTACDTPHPAASAPKGSGEPRITP